MATPNAALRIEDNENRVITFPEWCELNAISRATGHRIMGRGEGPVVLQLGARRIAITIRANREWQASRERASA